MLTEEKREAIVINDGKRSFKIIVRLDETGIVKMFCELDNSFSCTHSMFAWTLPKVQEMTQTAYMDMKTAGEAIP